MRKLSIMLVTVSFLGSALPADAQDSNSGRGEPGCDGMTALHLSSAVTGDPPLIWSARHGSLVPPPADGWNAGSTIPLGDIAGFRIAAIGGLPQRLSYNIPESGRGAGGGVILMSLLRPRHPARVRGAYP